MGIYQLIIESGQRAGQCVQPPGKNYTIGRDTGNDLQLVEDGVSGRHCELRVTRAGVMVRDSRSTNGVYVNSQRVEEVRLHRGDVIELGGARLRFEFLVAVPGEYRRRTPLFWISVVLVAATFGVEFCAIGIAVWTRRHRITPEESAAILRYFPPVPADALPDALLPRSKTNVTTDAGPAGLLLPVLTPPAIPGPPGMSAPPTSTPGVR